MYLYAYRCPVDYGEYVILVQARSRHQAAKVLGEERVKRPSVLPYELRSKWVGWDYAPDYVVKISDKKKPGVVLVGGSAP